MQKTVCDMPVIVITGGMASGKTTVTKMLADLGATIISADQIAREIVEPGKPVLEQIRQLFGPLVLTPEGELDRRSLANIIFDSPTARKKLEKLTHPSIRSEIHRQMEKALHTTSFVVLEIPLYFEGGHVIPGSEAWVVFVDKKTQLDRLMSRDNLDLSQAQSRLSSQMPLENKCLIADRVIDNSGTQEQTRNQVLKALDSLKCQH